TKNRLNDSSRSNKLYFSIGNKKLHLRLEISLTKEEEDLLTKLKNLKKNDFEDMSELSTSLSTLLTNVNVTTDLQLELNTKGLALFKSKENEKYFFFVDRKESSFNLINENHLKFFKIGMVKFKEFKDEYYYFIHHYDYAVSSYANENLRLLMTAKTKNSTNKDKTDKDYEMMNKARIFKQAIIKTLVKYIHRASLKDFSIYEYSDKNQRVKHLYFIYFDSFILEFLKRNSRAISKEVIIALDKNKNLVKDFLPFALMKISPTRILLNHLLYDKTKKDSYLIYLLYKFYSLKKENTKASSSDSKKEINMYCFYYEIKNPFSYDNQIIEDKESLSYEDLEEFKTLIDDEKDKEYIRSIVIKNNKTAFLNLIIKKIITNGNLVNDRIMKNLIEQDDTWIYLGAFIVMG
ncbi:MAG: hypothetical protein QXO21_02115, partial [Candidatus Anstonellales archaeon]